MSKKYKVGYGKPPKDHQWQPGQSGNPSGKKGKVNKAANARSLCDYIIEGLLEKVRPTVGGKTQEMPLLQALAKSLINDLLLAQPKEKILLLRQFESLGVFDGLQTRIHDAQFETDTGNRFSEEERLMIKVIAESIGIDTSE